MTNLDRIRNFSSYEMAVMFTELIKAAQQDIFDKFAKAGVTCTKYDLDNEIQIEIHKKWLESEVESK